MTVEFGVFCYWPAPNWFVILAIYFIWITFSAKSIRHWISVQILKHAECAWFAEEMCNEHKNIRRFSIKVPDLTAGISAYQVVECNGRYGSRVSRPHQRHTRPKVQRVFVPQHICRNGMILFRFCVQWPWLWSRFYGVSFEPPKYKYANCTDIRPEHWFHSEFFLCVF